MNTGSAYLIRQAEPSDLPACLDLWAKKAHTLAAGSTQQRLIDHGRHVIGRSIEDGVMHLVVTETGDVVECLSPADDSTGFRTPAEVALMREYGAGPLGPEHRSAGLGPLARALREVAETKDDLATARGLSADDDTFAVEADMLERRLHVLEARLREVQAAVDPDDMGGKAAIWTAAAAVLAQLKLDVPPRLSIRGMPHWIMLPPSWANGQAPASDAAAGARARTTG